MSDWRAKRLHRWLDEGNKQQLQTVQLDRPAATSASTEMPPRPASTEVKHTAEWYPILDLAATAGTRTDPGVPNVTAMLPINHTGSVQLKAETRDREVARSVLQAERQAAMLAHELRSSAELDEEADAELERDVGAAPPAASVTISIPGDMGKEGKIHVVSRSGARNRAGAPLRSCMKKTVNAPAPGVQGGTSGFGGRGAAGEGATLAAGQVAADQAIAGPRFNLAGEGTGEAGNQIGEDGNTREAEAKVKVRSVAFASHAHVRMFEHITQHKSKSKSGKRRSRAEADADWDPDTLGPGSAAAVEAAATLSDMRTEAEDLPAEGGNFSLFRARTPTMPSTWTSTPAPAHAPAADPSASASNTPVLSALSRLAVSTANLGPGISGGESDQRREHERESHEPARPLEPFTERNAARRFDKLAPFDVSLEMLELGIERNEGGLALNKHSDDEIDEDPYYAERGRQFRLESEQAGTRAPVAGQRDFPGVPASADAMDPRIEGDDQSDDDCSYAEIVRLLKLEWEQAGIRGPVAGQLDFTDVPALDNMTLCDSSDSASFCASELEASTAPVPARILADPAAAADIASAIASAEPDGSASAEPEPVTKVLRVTHRNTTPARYPATDKDADGNKENTLHAVTPSPPTIPIRTGRSKKRERAGAERAAPRRSGRLQVVREMR